MPDTEYNGWTNRATWNVALWIHEDWSYEVPRWARNRKLKDGTDLKLEMERQIEELELDSYYLRPQRGCRPTQFFTPDGDRFDDANWDELFEGIVLEERKEAGFEFDKDDE